jgi:hypothetical protein
MPKRSGGCGARAARMLAVALMLIGASGFTDQEERKIWQTLDPDNSGRVTKMQFAINKMNAFYFRHQPTDRWEMKPLSLEETGLSREFFNKIDKDHSGYITSLEIIDAIHFEDIDTKQRGYFDFSDLVTFLTKIGR